MATSANKNQKHSNILYGSLLGLLVLQYGISKDSKWLVYIIASILIISIVGRAFRMGVIKTGGGTPRPVFKNNSDRSESTTNGMPSLHTAASSLVVTVLVLGRVTPLMSFLAVGLLIGVIYFRMRGGFHDVPQVLGGMIFGVLLGIGIVSLKPTTSLGAILITLVVALGILALDTMHVFRSLYRAEEKKFPEWFDPTLTPLLDKKTRKSHLSLSARNFIVRTSGWPFDMLVPNKVKAEPIRVTWNNMENNLRNRLPLHLTPDVVVGIKSGGAVIAKFIADWYDVPFAYMRVSRYSGHSLWIQLQNLRGRINVSSISEPVLEDAVRGKNVLLVDDSLCSGMSLKIAKQHILKKGARSVTTLVYSVDSADAHLCDHFIVDVPYVAWPWGFDA